VSGGLTIARRLAWPLAIVVLGALLALAVRRLDVARVLLELARARPLWVVVATLCFASILPLWAAQWRLLAPPTPRRTFARLVGVVSMTSSVLNTTPMLVGEAAGVWFLGAEAGVDRASALAVLGMDQLLVGLAKLTVLGAAATLLPLPTVLRDGVRVLAVGVGGLLAVLLAMAWSGEAARERLTRLAPPRLAHAAARAAAALSPLRSPPRSAAAFALALLKKGAELLGILAIQHAFAVQLDPSSALLVLAALNLATLLPLVPGNAGVFEAAVVLAYSWLGVPPERALGMALVQHACYFAALALPGYAWLSRAPRARSAAAAP